LQEERHLVTRQGQCYVASGVFRIWQL